MFTPEYQPIQTLGRLPMAAIDRFVSVRLGTTHVKGNAEPTTMIGKFYNGRHHTTVLWRSSELSVCGPSAQESTGSCFP